MNVGNGENRENLKLALSDSRVSRFVSFIVTVLLLTLAVTALATAGIPAVAGASKEGTASPIFGGLLSAIAAAANWLSARLPSLPVLGLAALPVLSAAFFVAVFPPIMWACLHSPLRWEARQIASNRMKIAEFHFAVFRRGGTRTSPVLTRITPSGSNLLRLRYRVPRGTEPPSEGWEERLRTCAASATRAGLLPPLHKINFRRDHAVLDVLAIDSTRKENHG